MTGKYFELLIKPGHAQPIKIYAESKINADTKIKDLTKVIVDRIGFQSGEGLRFFYGPYEFYSCDDNVTLKDKGIVN